jgi:hypothetical protein
LVADVSKANDNFVFDYYYLSDVNRPKFYSYAAQQSPIDADHEVTLHAGDLTHHPITYLVSDTIQSVKSVQFMGFSSYLEAWGSYNPHGPILERPFSQDWYSTRQPSANFPFGGYLFNFQLLFTAHGTYFADGDETQLLRLPNRWLGDDGVVRQTLAYSDSVAVQVRYPDIVYGLGPTHYFGRTVNSSTELLTKANTTVGLVPNLFFNQLFDLGPQNLTYSLRDSRDSVLQSGLASSALVYVPYNDSVSERMFGVSLPSAGKYTLEFDDTHSIVSARQGTARVLLTADTRLADKNPPSMSVFTIVSDSAYTDKIMPGHKAQIEFAVSDDVQPASVSLSFETEHDTIWRNIPLTMNNGYYVGAIPDTLPQEFVTVRVLATDASGNIMDYRAEPAFHVGEYVNHIPSKATPLKPAIGDSIIAYSNPNLVRFSWKRSTDADNFDTLRYTVRLQGAGVSSGLSTTTTDTSASLAVATSLKADSLYKWWVETSDGHATVVSDTSWFRPSRIILGIKEQGDLPKEFALMQNYPNPFNPTTTIHYDVPRTTALRLTVYDVLGREVRTLVNETKQPGRYEVTFNATNLASGVYLYRLQAGSFVETRRLCLLR